MPERILRLAPLLAVILVIASYVLIDRHGPAATHDSLYYLEGASYWLQTGTFANNYWGNVVPEVHYAPLFSGALALLAALTGGTPLAVAQWLMPFLASLNIALCGWLFRLWKWSPMQVAGMLLLMGTAYPFFSMHWHIWSEPLYLSTILTATVLLVYWERSGKTSLLLLAAIIAGMSVLVRYAGLFVLPMFVLWVFSLRRNHRWFNSILFAGLALLPFLGWTVRNKLVSENLTSRSLFWDWAGLHELLRAFETVISWGNLAILGLGLLLYCFRRKSNLQVESMIWLIGGSIYVLLIFLAKSTIDTQIPIDSRLLSPLLLPILFIFGKEMMLWTDKQRNIWIAIALIGGLVQAASFAVGAYRDGWAFNDRRLFAEGSALSRMQTALPQKASVFATDVDAHYLAYLLKRPINYLNHGATLPEGAYLLRWKAPMPDSNSVKGSETLVNELVWYRHKAP